MMVTLESIREQYNKWAEEHYVDDNGVAHRKDGKCMPIIIDHMALLTTRDTHKSNIVMDMMIKGLRTWREEKK